MLVVLGIVIFFVGLLLSIAWHELGHLATAKMFGVKVTQYMVGFGRTLWSRKKGDTEYGIKAIPFGGYIRMIGMFPPQKDEKYGRSASTAPWRVMIEEAREAAREEVTEADAHRQFYQRKPWKRMIVMFAGPFMNLILAVGLFGGVLMIYGTPMPTTTVNTVSECVLPADAPSAAKCPPNAKPSPAAAAGFRPGDKIVSFNGKPYHSWEELRQEIRDSSGRVDVGIVRDGEHKTLHPELMRTQRPESPTSNDLTTVGFLGLAPTQPIVRQDIGGVAVYMGDMLVRGGEAVLRLPEKVPGLISAISGGEREKNSPVGVVGVSRIGGEVLSMEEIPPSQRLVVMVQVLAGVNLSLFLLNMLPLLPLDGGHIAGAVWESIRRGFAKLFRGRDPGPFDTAKLMPVAYAVSVVIIAYALLVLVADIVNPVTLS